jgi:hypothetical protein
MRMTLTINSDYTSLNSINLIIFVKEMRRVFFFAVETKFKQF